jgi:hypothetical protein
MFIEGKGSAGFKTPSSYVALTIMLIGNLSEV